MRAALLVLLAGCGTPWSLTGDDLLDNTDDVDTSGIGTQDTFDEPEAPVQLTVQLVDAVCDETYTGGAFVEAVQTDETELGVHLGGIAGSLCEPIGVSAVEQSGYVIVKHRLEDVAQDCEDPRPCWYDVHLAVSGVSGPGLIVVAGP